MQVWVKVNSKVHKNPRQKKRAHKRAPVIKNTPTPSTVTPKKKSMMRKNAHTRAPVK